MLQHLLLGSHEERPTSRQKSVPALSIGPDCSIESLKGVFAWRWSQRQKGYPGGGRVVGGGGGCDFGGVMEGWAVCETGLGGGWLDTGAGNNGKGDEGGTRPPVLGRGIRTG